MTDFPRPKSVEDALRDYAMDKEAHERFLWAVKLWCAAGALSLAAFIWCIYAT